MRLVTLSAPWKLLICMGLTDLIFTLPIIMAYFQLKGVDLAGALALQGLMRLGILLFELPTGYLADRWSRRRHLQVGSILWVLSLFILWQAHSFAGLALAQLTMALSIAFYSGTLQAYMHEALKAEGKLAEETRWQGRLYAASLIPCMLASLLGGWLYTLAPDAPVIATLASGLLGVYLTFTLPEIVREDAPRRHANPLRDLWLIGVTTFHGNSNLRWLLLGPALLISLTELYYWLLQSQFTALGASPLLLGLAFALYNAAAAIGATFLAERLKTPSIGWNMMALALLMLPAGLMLLSQIPWLMICGGILTGLLSALIWPTLITALNQALPDHERATVLSLNSILISLLAALMLLVTPLGFAIIGMTLSFLCVIAAALMLAAYPLWRLRQT